MGNYANIFTMCGAFQSIFFPGQKCQSRQKKMYGQFLPSKTCERSRPYEW